MIGALRNNSRAPSVASEAAERWLIKGTGLHSVSHPRSPPKGSLVTVTTCKYQDRTTPRQAPRFENQSNLPSIVSSSSSYLLTSPPQGRSSSSSGVNSSHCSGMSSLDKGSRRIPGAKKSLKNLFRRGSSETDIQYVSRSVLMP